ncbi:radical SAM protein [Candidatus Atribacteria bacterium 1244-E10-H5-B2]|nr:MAG: radical SAM protein [Candidatus Atribacteria bacterium 1244-E10-H5-B2]
MNFKNMISTREEIESFFGTSPLMGASIRVTKACNFHCKHCYAEGGKKLENELNLGEMKNVIDQLKALNVMEIFFTGGEPFTRRDMVDILNYTNQKGIKILISTNGSLITKGIMEKIGHIDFKQFQISIDGPEEVHDFIRIKGAFTKATKALDLCGKYVKKNLTVGTVLMKYNWQVLPEVIEIAAEHGADMVSLMLLIYGGRANESIVPSVGEQKESLDAFFRKYASFEDKIRFATNTTLPSSMVPSEWRRKKIHEHFACCNFPYSLAVEANGEVAPCDGFFATPDFICGNIREKSIKEIWESLIFKEMRSIDPSDLRGVCSKCKFVKYCAGGCRASSYLCYGNMTMPDPICQRFYEAESFPKDCLVNK